MDGVHGTTCSRTENLMDRDDVLAVEDAVAHLLTTIDESLSTATKDDYKNKFIEEISDWYEIKEILERMGFGEDEQCTQ